MSGQRTALRLALVAATALSALPALAGDAPAPVVTAAPAAALEDQFRDPPNSARPRVWWHWMNGNITQDGIAKDLAWMKRTGIGGLQNFDANLQTPPIVDQRLVYMTPEWKDAFRFTAAEAERLGLELAIAASPGWSETGGPWVKPEDGLKKLVWTETTVAGGKRFAGKLAAPPDVAGPYQSLPMPGGIEEMISGVPGKPGPRHYGEAAVLAYPVAAMTALIPVSARDGSGKALDPAALGDADLTKGVELTRETAAIPASVTVDYGRPATARSASLFAPGAAMIFTGALFAPLLEASDDGAIWRPVATLETGQSSFTASFPAATARYFRLSLPPRQGASFVMSKPAPGTVMGDMFEQMGKAFSGKPLPLGDFRLTGEARIDKAETKAGFIVAKDYYALGGPQDGATGLDPAEVLDLTGRMQPDGTLDWTAPKLPAGRQWRVLRLGYSLLGTTNHPAPPEATGLEVDKFDGPAVRRYMEHYIGMYREASGGMIGGKGVRAILTDSIEVGAANWTPQMIAQFKRLRGYDPVPWLPALTGTLIGTRAQSDKFLYDYRRTLADLMASEHYGTVAKVAHENGLIVYGEALEDRRPSLGDDMAMRRHADVPMAAMWTHSREEGPKLTYLADIKGAASVAHIYGQNLVAAELLTASNAPWAFAPNDLRRVIDLEFVTGVNRPVIHTSVHQPRDDKFPGVSLFIFGQYFNRHETWAEMAKPWVDYLSRTSLMLQQGRNVADVGYFYGEEAPLTGLYSDSRVADAPVANAYDFVNAEALGGALSNDGDELVTPGGARYKALYLGGSSRKMTLAALRRIAELAEGGATIVGNRPEELPSLTGDGEVWRGLADRLWSGGGETTIGKGRVIASSDIDAALRRIGVAPDFRFTGGHADSDIPFVHRKLADGDSYYLVNRLNRPETVEAHFRVTGKVPELWHADSGTSQPVGYRIVAGETIVPLSLAAEELLFVVFRKPATADALTVPPVVPQTLATLDGPWAVSFQPDRGAPASTTLATLAPLDEHPDPRIKYYSGVATYAKDFAAPKGWKKGQPLWLDLGEVRELAQVTVNGQDAGTAWHAPYRIDMGKQAKPGRNRLEIKVANLWVNRLIGDAQPGAKPITWTAMPTYKATAPLRRSGLIGPVTVLGAAR